MNRIQFTQLSIFIDKHGTFQNQPVDKNVARKPSTEDEYTIKMYINLTHKGRLAITYNCKSHQNKSRICSTKCKTRY